jgi:hypothetical protein
MAEPGIEPNYTLECPVAEALAKKSFDRSQSAIESKDFNAAIMYSKSFWDIYDLSKSCNGTKGLAEEMNKFHLGKAASVSTNETNQNIAPKKDFESFYNTACKNSPCSFEYVNSTKNTKTGYESPDKIVRDNPNREIKIEKFDIKQKDFNQKDLMQQGH